MPKKLTQEEFISRAQEAGPDTFDLSSAVYTNAQTPITVRCTKHDLTFTMKPQKVMAGQNGCPDCSGKRLTTADFIRRATKVHGDRFDYTNTVYTKMLNKVTILCHEHGEYQQLPQAHLNGLVGCNECNGQTALTTETFINQAIIKHGENAYDYSLIGIDDVKNLHSKVKIKCLKHEVIFEQFARSHLRGARGCHVCSPVSRMTPERLQEKAAQVFPDKSFNYSKVDYQVGVRNKTFIGCHVEEHGFYEQSLDGHFSGKEGCRKCDTAGVSKMENDLSEFIENLGFEVIRNNRTIIAPYEVDIYVPAKKVAVEFNGVYWHSDKFKDDKWYHYKKSKAAESNGVRLLHVWSDEWTNKHSIVERHIKHVLGVNDTQRVYARKCAVSVIDKNAAHDFLEENHIQGRATATHHIGLTHDDMLVAVASFKKSGNDYILTRYATSQHVIGGHSKAVSFFEKNYAYGTLVTFADTAFSDGNLYTTTGWTRDTELAPDYSYVVNGVERRHKFGYRKNRFKTDPALVYDESMTETELAVLNDLPRVYDAGKVRFVKVHPNP
jgi:very-short-patch-repair endonuclease